MNFRHDEWIEFDRIINRQNEDGINSTSILIEEKNQNDQDIGSNLFKI